MNLKIIIAFCLAPLATTAFAVGEGDVPSPAPIAECKNGKIWDADARKCVAPQDSRLDDNERFDAARAYAYADQPGHALAALAAMSAQDTDRVLTYKGFAHRKAGNIALAQFYYARALARNPDNNLARSYRAQGYVEAGQLALARAELTEIRRRGGRNSWAEVSLGLALESGRGFAY